MKVGDRGRVAIPREIRERFGIEPDTEVNFRITNGTIILAKAPKRLGIANWRGRCDDPLKSIGYASVDEFIEGVRGR